MSVHGEPYIPASQSPLELTTRVIIVGILLGILMTAANAYLGLYAGMTVSASIPAAVMSMIILRSLFKDVSILENNAVQTMASAGESLAAGIIFTVPALLVIPNVWDEIQLVETTIIALLGGLLGTMFTIALRRLFIVEEALPYPEGVACREVLVAGEDATFAITHGNGQINYGTDYYFNAAHGLTAHTYLYDVGSPITSNDPAADAAIISDISAGSGFANYTAHCGSSGWSDPSFENSDIAHEKFLHQIQYQLFS